MVTILWIEDEIHNLQALKKMLNRRGITVMKARSKREALEKLNLKFDLILLDVILPQDMEEEHEDLVGLNILRKLMIDHCAVPIFVFTIVRDSQIENEIENYGVPYYYKGCTLFKDLCDDIVKATGG